MGKITGNPAPSDSDTGSVHSDEENTPSATITSGTPSPTKPVVEPNSFFATSAHKEEIKKAEEETREKRQAAFNLALEKADEFEKNNLNSKPLQELYFAGIITLASLKETNNELKLKYENPGINHFLITGELKRTELDNLTPQECSNLKHYKNLAPLLEKKEGKTLPLNLDSLRTLKSKELTNLLDKSIQQLILEGQLEINKAKNLLPVEKNSYIKQFKATINTISNRK